MPLNREKKKKSMKRNEDSLRDLWDNIKCTNIYVTVVAEEEREKKGLRTPLKNIIAENVPDLEKESLQSRKYRIPYKIDTKSNT